MDEIDLDSAAKAGVIGEDQAIALRKFMARSAGLSIASQEKFQLGSSFADITRAVGFLLVLCTIPIGIAAGLQLGQWSKFRPISENLPAFAGSIFLLLALFGALFVHINRQRDLARFNPATAAAILIGGSLAAFVLALVVELMLVGPYTVTEEPSGTQPVALSALGAAVTVSGFLWLLWRSTRFPPIPAAWSVFVLFMVSAQIDNFTTSGSQVDYGMVNIVALIVAIPVVIAAIWVDLTDIRRETPRSQVAFWLHIVAGAVLARACFGLNSGDHWASFNLAVASDLPGLGVALLLLAIGLCVSLILDRRSLMMATALPLGASLGLVGLPIIGGFLILASYRWHRWRGRMLGALPVAIVAQVPRHDIEPSGQRPSRRHLELEPRRALSSTH